jgi:hypothetical protein
VLGFPVLCFAALGPEPALALLALVVLAVGWWAIGSGVEECVCFFSRFPLILGFFLLLDRFPVCWCRWAGCLVITAVVSILGAM